MTEIKTFSFDKNSIECFKTIRLAQNWPLVYIIENKNEFYIGETINAFTRTRQHVEDEKRKFLRTIHLLLDEDFNKSATLDIESSLIEFMSAEGKALQNGNKGLSKHNYYDRERYRIKFEELWDKLKKKGIVSTELLDLQNRDLFKYSPYKTLTTDQLFVANELIEDFKNFESKAHIVKGGPGTGKSILAVYLMKYLIDESEFTNKKIAIVIPMTSFRKTLKKVFSKIKNLKASMVIGPSEVVNKEFDILIVDEAHRLKSRKNLSPGEYNTFDKNNEMLGIKNGNQLDWIFAKSTKQVLFYDENQSVRPSDINHLHFNKSHFIVHTLKSQLRVKGGNEYIEFISNVLSNKKPDFKEFKDYEFKIFDNLKEMVFLIKEKENQELKGKKQGLSRLLAGYAWDWTSKETKNAFDIVIKDVKLKWNSSNIDWVNSENATNEVGCIHTIQGYDLNYAGVIIGPELSYDFSTNSFIIYKDRYKDKKGKASIEDEETLKKYILNIYKVLLTRGIFGTFVYICDNNLRKYFQHVLESEKYSHEQQQVAMTERNRKYEK